MNVSDFDFDLPDAQIAQEPRPRGRARLLVVRRGSGTWQEHAIADLPALLTPGDLLVANDTKVFPARLLGRRLPGGGAAECLLLERETDSDWQALVHPGQRLKPGGQMVFADDARAPGIVVTATVLQRRFHGRRLVRLAQQGAADLDAAVDALGHVPLPPYIHRDDRPDDRVNYQTVFARARGSIAAPTAGIHFDAALIAALRVAGIGWTTVTLHVGYGTFKPVRVDRVEDHTVDPEHYEIPADTVTAMRDARASGQRVIAVGTTTTRALETAAKTGAGAGVTELFIHPGHAFRAIDGLLTNFHLPRSSLLMLVAAFTGVELTMAAYHDAVARGFHFYSYGDAMLVL